MSPVGGVVKGPGPAPPPATVEGLVVGAFYNSTQMS